MKYTDEYWNDIAKVSEMIPGKNALSGKSILVTGAGGLICSSVIDILFYLNKAEAAGIQLFLAGRSRERIEARFNAFSNGADYTYVWFDALSGKAPDVSADYIVHGAGYANPSLYSSEPIETMLGHIKGTNTLLELAARSEGTRLLYISSSEVYGKRNDSSPYKEEDYSYVDIRDSRAAYPCAKRAAETLCAAYREQYGIDVVTVRPGHIYGPTAKIDDDRASAQFMRCALEGKAIVMKSAGRQLRSYCYSLDCASAVLTALLRGKTGEAYNISNAGSVVTIRDMAETLARIAHVDLRFEVPSSVELKGYNRMSNSSLDASQLEGLGWKACFDLETGLDHCFRQMGGETARRI